MDATQSAAGAAGFFASDNTSGMCPEALEYLQRANAADDHSYGADQWTAQASQALRELFETHCEVFFVFNGTAANALALASLCQPYHGIICHQQAHIETSECAAPEFFTNGSKLLPIAAADGRINPAAVAELADQHEDMHAPRPQALSLTQASEFGTVYEAAQLHALCDVAHDRGMTVHMDGARFANACASLGASAADLSWRAGVDVLCFSGTKNGLAFGEVMVFFDPKLARDFAYRRKQAGQLASKMRFLSAPWLGLLESGAWLDNARHANTMARRLAAGVAALDNVQLRFEVQANAVFLTLPEAVQAALRARGWIFHNFLDANCIRLVCAWNTTPDSVDALIADMHRLAHAPTHHKR